MIKGGYAGHSTGAYDSHLLYTLSALQILCIYDHQLDHEDTQKTVECIPISIYGVFGVDS